MGNERKLRLIQVAKEFNVGINTITDFLHKKGIKSDGSPNTQVDAETYAVLEKEFGANRSAAGARDSIRERIAQKQATITIEGQKKQEREEEKEVVIKSNVINVRDEIQQPKFLGKIDLSPKPKAEPKPAPEAAPAPEKAERSVAEAAPQAPAKAEPQPAEPRAEAKAEAAKPAPEKAEKPAAAANAEKSEPAAPAPEKAEPKAEEPKPEAPKDNIFRPEIATLTGPQVLGTMDVSGFVPGGKHKRKRLSKEKVDVSKAQKGGGQSASGSRGGSQGGGQNGQGGQH
ncbi:MAG: translation initiation factor IF-2, partial [Alistipes sp.]|nr:translation initiation factor IF-2 [Alistipes sp.]